MAQVKYSPIGLAGLLLLIINGILAACFHSNSSHYGLQSNDLAYIPARIAVLPCRQWPEQASYRDMPLSNISEDIREELCTALDSFVLEGFQGQPYMRGISPKVVQALLEREDQEELLDRIDEVWRRQNGDCTRCSSPTRYYQETVQKRNNWRLWLSNFSRAAFNSDAILIPFVTYAHESRTDERGLMVAFRRTGAMLMLIDTNTGALIWTGGREAQAQHQMPRAQAGPGQPDFPEWTEVMDRLFISEIWQQFPGRQNY